jgi:hypothetical protein
LNNFTVEVDDHVIIERSYKALFKIFLKKQSAQLNRPAVMLANNDTTDEYRALYKIESGQLCPQIAPDSSAVDILNSLMQCNCACGNEEHVFCTTVNLNRGMWDAPGYDQMSIHQVHQNKCVVVCTVHLFQLTINPVSHTQKAMKLQLKILRDKFPDFKIYPYWVCPSPFKFPRTILWNP